MKYIIEFKKFIRHVINNHSLIFGLIKNDFQKQYLGSYLGLFWAFVQPLVFIAVIWFVFDVGFRTAPVNGNVPFFLWLIVGMIPWFFFSGALESGTHAVVANDFLVKKVAFRVSILPLVPIGSAFIIHFVLLFCMIVIFIFHGFYPSIYWLELIYYLFVTFILLLGLTWLTSSVSVFIKDIGSVVSIAIQIGFWATPIFWSLSSIPKKYQILVKLNPATYIIEGFRDTFINHIWFWEKPLFTIYTLTVTLVIFFLGAIVFRKLRPHFGDVL